MLPKQGGDFARFQGPGRKPLKTGGSTMNRGRSLLAASLSLVSLAVLLPAAVSPAEAHGWWRHGFGFPVVYGPRFFAPPPPPVFVPPRVAYIPPPRVAYFPPPRIAYIPPPRVSFGYEYRSGYGYGYRRPVHRHYTHRVAHRRSSCTCQS